MRASDCERLKRRGRATTRCHDPRGMSGVENVHHRGLRYPPVHRCLTACASPISVIRFQGWPPGRPRHALDCQCRIDARPLGMTPAVRGADRRIPGAGRVLRYPSGVDGRVRVACTGLALFPESSGTGVRKGLVRIRIWPAEHFAAPSLEKAPSERSLFLESSVALHHLVGHSGCIRENCRRTLCGKAGREALMSAKGPTFQHHHRNSRLDHSEHPPTPHGTEVQKLRQVATTPRSPA